MGTQILFQINIQNSQTSANNYKILNTLFHIVYVFYYYVVYYIHECFD